MHDLIIRKYNFNKEKNRFELIDNVDNKCKDIPKSFVIQENNDIRNKKADYMMYCLDLVGQLFRTGLRILRSNIQYGDRWWPSERKSFMILRYLEKNTIEFHYFDGFCPINKEERSAFLTYYFNESKITGNEFLKKHNGVVKLLKKNTSIRNISKLTEKSTKTVQKVKNWI
jgi:uncharacterized protein YerC